MYLAGLKLGQTLPTVGCGCGCGVSLELPLAALGVQGWDEIPGGVSEPDPLLADRDVNRSDSAAAADAVRDGGSTGQAPTDTARASLGLVLQARPGGPESSVSRTALALGAGGLDRSTREGFGLL